MNQSKLVDRFSPRICKMNTYTVPFTCQRKLIWSTRLSHLDFLLKKGFIFNLLAL